MLLKRVEAFNRKLFKGYMWWFTYQYMVVYLPIYGGLPTISGWKNIIQ